MPPDAGNAGAVRLPGRLVVDSYSRHWWDAAHRGELLVVRCSRCGALSYPPRPFCPECWCEAVSWHRVSGSGTLYTWSVVRVNDTCPSYLSLPYVVAMVDLVEGPRVATVLRDVDPVELAIGAPLSAGFVEVAPGVSLVMFRPAPGDPEQSS